VLALAKTMANRIAAKHPDVTRVLLFGSYARGDFSARSDLDLLIVLKESRRPLTDRIDDFLADCAAYPTDVFPLTEGELRDRVRAGDHFWARALREAVVLFDRSSTTTG
jgi:predicted nucleotidyltransferase